MSIFISGGAGFIGSHLAETLSKKDEKITIYDNFSAGRFNNKLLENFPNIRIIDGDITDYPKLNDAMKGCVKIYHLAALNRAPRSIENPFLSNSVNITGTLNLLEIARKMDIKDFAFSSSSSVYGLSEQFPRKEDGKTIPTHPYGVGKLSSEYYCNVYHQLYGINVVILRYFAVYGPRQSPNMKYSAVIPIFIKAFLSGKTIAVYGDGEQKRNFTYVSDTINATIKAMKLNKGGYKIINIANHNEVTLNEILERLKEISGRKPDVAYKPFRKGDVKRANPDLSRMNFDLGYQAQNNIESGLRKTFEWYQKHPRYFDV
ncbi:LPS biosynthesis protein WbpP [Candidatus Heimdallarchaeota archaeon B3_Heim]|nr:MAG: LPS biosynthesis protein WbpP [Candidatus Heimdallarchaeota archaeon B3_Heim]